MTTADKDKVKSPLPESLMKAIKVTVESPDLTPREKFEAVMTVTTSYGLYCAAERIDPTAYAIPSKQWGEISQMLMTLADTDVSKVNMAMEWMNAGPSGYEE
jgi:hypothetical protein